MLDLHVSGAFSLWKWSPAQDSLRSFGRLTAGTLADWVERIHPRDRSAFSALLNRRWAPAPPYFALDYRIAPERPGDWIHVRHTLGFVERDGSPVLSGMVEELTSPNLSRTLLEHTEAELREGESHIHRFTEEVLGLVGASDPAPLLDAIRRALRADSVALVHLDDRFEITGATCSHLDTPAFPIQALRGPLARAFLHDQPGGHTRILEFDLEAAEVSFFMVKPVSSGDASAGGALCAGFRTPASRVAARRYRAVLSLVAAVGGQFLGRARREVLRENLLSEFCEIRQRANAGSAAFGMARELRNLLDPLSGQLAGLDAAFEAGDWIAWKEAWKRVAESTGSARECLERLLLLGSRATAPATPCEVNRLAADAVATVQQLVEPRIEIRTELDPAAGFARLDGEVLRGMLSTLLLDARAAMPSGGVIRVSTRRACSSEDGDFVAIQVADQGEPGRAGVLPGALDPVFFEDSDLSGPAFGLFHVTSLVSDHGGRLETSGDLGPGNTLRLLIPAASRPPEPSVLPDPLGGGESEAPAEHRLHGATVLLVEDEEPVRQMVRKVLEVFGCTVIEAASGRAALELWPSIQDRVSVVVSDVIMPGGVSGWDLARDLHRRHPGLGILLTSGKQEQPGSHGLDQTDPIEFLQKPYPVSALRSCLTRLLERSPA